jgi:hypothetical protein
MHIYKLIPSFDCSATQLSFVEKKRWTRRSIVFLLNYIVMQSVVNVSANLVPRYGYEIRCY